MAQEEIKVDLSAAEIVDQAPSQVHLHVVSVLSHYWYYMSKAVIFKIYKKIKQLISFSPPILNIEQ